MERFIRFFIKNSLLVNFVSIIIILSGLLTVYTIKKETRPLVNIGGIVISTAYQGASPTDVEKLISIPIEDELTGIDGISKLQSTSYTGLSRVYIEIDPDYPDEDKVTNDVYRAIDGISDLPANSEDPEIFEIKTSNFPVVYLIMYSDNGIRDLYEASDLIEHKMTSAKGVSEVEFYGKMDPVFDVIVDPVLMQKYDLSFSDFINILRSYNSSGPAGSIVSDVEDTQIRLDQELNTTDKIENLVLRINDFGKGIKVREVANVMSSYDYNRVINKFEGKTSIGVSIKKSNEADTIKTVKNIKEKLSEIEKLFPKSVSYKVIFDDSVYVKDTLTFTSQNAIFGLILVVIVLLIGLHNLKMSLVTSFGLPIAFFGSIVLIFIFGYTLNMMTLIGFILVIGMLVDDGIVVSENIYYNYEQGLPIEEAGVKGASQVILPVIGAVSTSILSFLPLIFMQGVMGKFMSVIPVAVISALVFSLIECFLILPNHVVDIMKLGKKDKKIKSSPIVLKIEKYYTKLIEKFVNHKLLVTFSSILFLVLVGVFAANTLKVELFSVKGVTDFSIIIKGKDNIPIEDTVKASQKIENIIQKFIPKEIEAYSSTIGRASRQSGAFLDIGTNYAKITTYFPELGKRKYDEADTIKRIREAVLSNKAKDFEVFFDIRRGGPPTGSPVDLMIKSEDMDNAATVTKRIRKFLEEIDGVVDINDTINDNKYEYKLELNQKIAQELGISASEIQLVAMSAFEGIAITSVRTGRYDTDIRVVYPKDYRDNINKFMNIKIKTKLNTYVPFKKLLKLTKQNSASEINRDDQSRYISLSAGIDSDKQSSKELNNLIKANMNNFLKGFKNINIEYGGEEEETNELVKDLIKLFIIAIICIFMIISLIFNSLVYPFFVLLAIPFGISGAMLALISHDVKISVAVMVALVGLTGVVVNDAILLIKTIVNTLRSDKNIDFTQAVIMGAKRRLRPILLTSVTTLAGLFPAAYELFGVNQFMKEMSLVMGWGLFFSTIVTMLSIPTFLICAKQCSMSVKRIFIRKT